MQVPYAHIVAVDARYLLQGTEGPQLVILDVFKCEAASRRPISDGKKSLAIIPIQGYLSKRAGLWGPGIATLVDDVRQAIADKTVAGVVLDVDSPGGSVYGVHEATEALRAMRGVKPVIALVNDLAASAAYWLASAADTIIATPSSELGSIGVIAIHFDVSRMLANDGIEVTLVSAGEYKTDANPYQPLSVGAVERIQARVDDYYSMFVESVARNRGVTSDVVRTNYGKGAIFGAKDAVKAGMANRIGTMDDIMKDYEVIPMMLDVRRQRAAQHAKIHKIEERQVSGH